MMLNAVRSGRQVAFRRGFSAGADGPIGFIGCGNMGAPMARNLLKAGRKVIAFDLSEAGLRSVTQAGGTAAASPADVVAKSRTIITMLPSIPAVRAVYFGENGLVAGAQKGDLFIDCSTIEPLIAQEVAKATAGKGATMVDAPVSGGTLGAENATLTFMVGGSKQAFSEAEALLKHMGKRTVHCGDVGMGTAAKLCNNLVLGISMAAVCEGHALADRLGLDQKTLAEILNTSTGRCWSSDTYNPCPGVMDGVPASRGYTGGFGCDLMIKDLGLATGAAHSAKSKLGLPMGSLALQMYSMMSQHGAGHKDFSGLYEFIAKAQGKK